MIRSILYYIVLLKEYMLNRGYNTKRSFINGIHQWADGCRVRGMMIASVVSSSLSTHMPPLFLELTVFIHHLLLSGGKLEVNCQSERKSTFNLEEAIRVTLFPVNAMDKKDKADGPQSMQARLKVKHTMWSFQWTVWLASFPTLPGNGRTHNNTAAGLTYSISKSHQHQRLHKICIAW